MDGPHATRDEYLILAACDQHTESAMPRSETKCRLLDCRARALIEHAHHGKRSENRCFPNRRALSSSLLSTKLVVARFAQKTYGIHSFPPRISSSSSLFISVSVCLSVCLCVCVCGCVGGWVCVGGCPTQFSLTIQNFS